MIQSGPGRPGPKPAKTGPARIRDTTVFTFKMGPFWTPFGRTGQDRPGPAQNGPEPIQTDPNWLKTDANQPQPD